MTATSNREHRLTESAAPHQNANADGAAAPRVTSLELFSDLVFVFAVTQLTSVIATDPTWAGVLHVLLLFGMLWWIYGGYIWLTNSVRPDRLARKFLLLVAMAGFLMIGLAIPRAFRGDGIAFGIGYLLVVLIHAGLFIHGRGRDAAASVIRLGTLNTACALLLIVAGSQPSYTETLLWIVALAIQIVTPFVTSVETFRLEPGHFVERYGLLVLIALGESLVAVGSISRGRHLTAWVVVLSLFGLMLTAALWWIYFAGDDTNAEEILRSTPDDKRPMLALSGYFYAQIPMLLGIVWVAAAIRIALPSPAHPAAGPQAILLAGGVESYLIGDLCFRAVFRLPRAPWRFVALAVVPASVPIGLNFSLIAQLAFLSVALVAALAAENVRGMDAMDRSRSPQAGAP